MVRSILFSLAFALALGAAPALADPTPAPAESPSAAPLPTVAPSPAGSPSAAATAAAPAPVPSVDQAIKVRALDWLHRLQSGTIDRAQLSRAFNTVLTPSAVDGVKAQLLSLGKIKGSTFTGDTQSHGVHGYQFEVDFAVAKYTYLFEVNEQDDIAGIYLAPMK